MGNRTSALGTRPTPQAERDDTDRPCIDVPTLVALAVVAWAATNVLHEIVGHAGATALLGIPVRAVSTTTVYIDWTAVESMTEDRIISAAGVVVNLLTGTMALAALSSRRITAKPLRCFLWMFATMSFIVVTMNLVTAPLLGGGDWIEVIEGLEPRGVYLAAVLGAGVVLTIGGYTLPLRAWMPAVRERTVRLQLTVIPVLTLTVFQTLSVVPSPFATAPPDQNHLLFSLLAYFHFWLWAVVVYLVPKPRSTAPVDRVLLPRSRPWLIAGATVFLLFVFVLGPGLGPLGDDPRLN